MTSFVGKRFTPPCQLDGLSGVLFSFAHIVFGLDRSFTRPLKQILRIGHTAIGHSCSSLARTIRVCANPWSPKQRFGIALQPTDFHSRARDVRFSCCLLWPRQIPPNTTIRVATRTIQVQQSALTYGNYREKWRPYERFPNGNHSGGERPCSERL